MSDSLTINGLVKWETFQAVVTERDRLAEQGVRDRELLVMVTVERDRLRALVRELIEPKPVRMTSGGVVLSDEYMDRANELLTSARALLGEVG